MIYFQGIASVGDEYPSVMMTVHIKRNPLYFEIYLVLPALLLSFMLIPMFALPVESGEKVSVGM